jgi:hypothetical protein
VFVVDRFTRNAVKLQEKIYCHVGILSSMALLKGRLGIAGSRYCAHASYLPAG